MVKAGHEEIWQVEVTQLGEEEPQRGQGPSGAGANLV